MHLHMRTGQDLRIGGVSTHTLCVHTSNEFLIGAIGTQQVLFSMRARGSVEGAGFAKSGSGKLASGWAQLGVGVVISNFASGRDLFSLGVVISDLASGWDLSSGLVISNWLRDGIC